MPLQRDVGHYKVLGLDKSASQQDVKKAYKKLAREWHPDKNPKTKEASEKKFKEISEAHRVLSDGNLRYDYDKAKENEERFRTMEEQRKKQERVQRMAREQEDYVKKQQDKRRKAQQMRAQHADLASDYKPFDDVDKSFQDFFKDRNNWRETVPNLFSAENSGFGTILQQVNDMMAMASDFPTQASSHQVNASLSSDLRRMQYDVSALRRRQSRLDDRLSRFKSNFWKNAQLYGY